MRVVGYFGLKCGLFFGQKLHRFCHAFGGFQQPFAIDIFAQEGNHLVDMVGYKLAVLLLFFYLHG